jgi:hypothetical protein
MTSLKLSASPLAYPGRPLSVFTVFTSCYPSRPQPPSPFASRVLSGYRTIGRAISSSYGPKYAVGLYSWDRAGLVRAAFHALSSISDAYDFVSVRMGAPRLPCPPTVPRSITQVELGTARNFTTGRPILQNIADNVHNVPVASRALLEADPDMKDRGRQQATR